MSVSDYPMGDAVETECPECGRTAAMVVVDRGSEQATFIHCYRCGHESEEIEEYDDGGDNHEDQDNDDEEE